MVRFSTQAGVQPSMFGHVLLLLDFVGIGVLLWYLFLKKERTYRLKGNPWGNYYSRSVGFYSIPQVAGRKPTSAASEATRKTRRTLLLVRKDRKRSGTIATPREQIRLLQFLQDSSQSSHRANLD
jgi:hypothetical protein